MTARLASAEVRYRSDIQALRGYAVVLVILYHANPYWLPLGFLGVDVFFVISGYVITRMLAGGVASGSFSLSQFYLWRAKRILPAAYATFLAVALTAPLFLSVRQLQDLAQQIIGGLFFCANIVLWHQTGYFESAAETKPLLHIWSLAIEEQFYLLLPAFFLITPNRFWRFGVALIVGLSFALWIYGLKWHPVASFYLLPTRAWELALGALGALAPAGLGTRLRHLAPVAMIALFALPFAQGHMEAGTVVLCCATLAILVAEAEWLSNNPVTSLLARIGDSSYSLYLAHWPVFSFLQTAWTGAVPTYARAIGVLLSFLLGLLLHFTVERPLRRLELNPRALLSGLAVTSTLVAGSALSLYSYHAPDIAKLLRPNHGLSPACDFPGLFVRKRECANSERPDTLLWGDSYAMHLASGMVWDGTQFMQATKSVCGPFLTIAPFEKVVRDGHGTHWAEGCMAFNRSVLDYLRAMPEIEVVVLSSALWAYVGSDRYTVLVRRGDKFVAREGSHQLAAEAIEETAAAVRALGKRVVIVSPPPSSGVDLTACAEQSAQRRISFGGGTHCEIAAGAYATHRAGVIAALRQVSTSVPVIWLDKYLCDAQRCATFIDGRFIYRDVGHLSYEGSERLARRMGLARLLRDAAR